MDQRSLLWSGALAATLLGCGSSDDIGVDLDGGAGKGTGGTNEMGAGTSGGTAGATGGRASGGAGGEAGSGDDAADTGGSAGGGTVDAGDGSSDSGAGEDASSPFACLANEHLAIHIAGTPSLDVTDPPDPQCLSRYLPANDESAAMLNFDWVVGSTTISVVVRLYDALPGQSGTFTPFAVLISQGNDSWLGLQDKCHVTIGTSARIIPVATPPEYRVTGSVACDAGWALGKPDDVLQQFEFRTRVVGY